MSHYAVGGVIYPIVMGTPVGHTIISSGNLCFIGTPLMGAGHLCTHPGHGTMVVYLSAAYLDGGLHASLEEASSTPVAIQVLHPSYAKVVESLTTQAAGSQRPLALGEYDSHKGQAAHAAICAYTSRVLCLHNLLYHSAP